MVTTSSRLGTFFTERKARLWRVRRPNCLTFHRDPGRSLPITDTRSLDLVTDIRRYSLAAVILLVVLCGEHSSVIITLMYAARNVLGCAANLPQAHGPIAFVIVPHAHQFVMGHMGI